jgi:hypothetical protein
MNHDIRFSAGHYYETGEDLTGREGQTIILKDGKAYISMSPRDARVVGFVGHLLTNSPTSLGPEVKNSVVYVVGIGDSREWISTTTVDENGDIVDSFILKHDGPSVCSEGGPIRVGDMLCSSSTPGLLMKQPDNLMHSYTVARAMEPVSFESSLRCDNIYCVMTCG